MSDNLKMNMRRMSMNRFSRGRGKGQGVQLSVFSESGLVGGEFGAHVWVQMSREEAGQLAEELLRFANGNEQVE